jgi:hypothetical protein
MPDTTPSPGEICAQMAEVRPWRQFRFLPWQLQPVWQQSGQPIDTGGSNISPTEEAEPADPE